MDSTFLLKEFCFEELRERRVSKNETFKRYFIVYHCSLQAWLCPSQGPEDRPELPEAVDSHSAKHCEQAADSIRYWYVIPAVCMQYKALATKIAQDDTKIAVFAGGTSAF